MQGPGVGMETRIAWGIQGIQREWVCVAGTQPNTGLWGELVDPKGLGWGC